MKPATRRRCASSRPRVVGSAPAPARAARSSPSAERAPTKKTPGKLVATRAGPPVEARCPCRPAVVVHCTASAGGGSEGDETGTRLGLSASEVRPDQRWLRGEMGHRPWFGGCVTATYVVHPCHTRRRQGAVQLTYDSSARRDQD